MPKLWISKVQAFHLLSQWWTRILHMNSTPYDYTLAIDSDRVACHDISVVFELLKDYDMLEVSAGILPAFDNGVIAYKKGPRFDELLANWKHYQIKRGQFGNDQPALGDALDKTVGFSSGILPPTWQVKYIPAAGEKWGAAKMSRTLVLHGNAMILAGTACQGIMQASDRPRIIAYNAGKTPAYQAMFSQAECEAFLENQCAHAEIDWEFNYKALPRTEYLKRYGY